MGGTGLEHRAMVEARVGFGRKALKGVTPYLFLLPALIPYGIFSLYPMFQSIRFSFFTWDGLTPTKIFTGFGNYWTELTNDPVFNIALVNNIKWTITSLILPVVVGFVFALYFGRDKKGFGAYRATIYFPAVLSSVMVSMVWTWIYNPNFGVINTIAKGVSHGAWFFNWWANPNTIIYYLAIAGSWGYCGFCMLLFITGLRAIPVELFEAARIDGATKWQELFRITIPLLRTTTNLVVTSTIIFSFQVFDYVILMTNGGPGRATNVLATWSYSQFFNYYSVGRGTAIAVLLGACPSNL